MIPCRAKVIWGLIPKGERGIPLCREHVGHALENLLLRDVVDYGFAYLRGHDPNEHTCGGTEAGRLPIPEVSGSEAAIEKA